MINMVIEMYQAITSHLTNTEFSGLDPSVVYTSCISEESIEKMATDDQLTASTAL